MRRVERFRSLVCAFAVAACALSGRDAASAEEAENAEDGEHAAPSVVYPRPGPALIYARQPVLSRETRACSTRIPLCVRAPRTVADASMMAVLQAADDAWETLTEAIGLPPPDLDLETATYEITLLDGARDRTSMTRRDVRSRIDRASATTVLSAEKTSACLLRARVAREIARAILFRVAPATDEGTALAQTTALAHLVVPCASALETSDVALFQQRHERSVADPHASDDGAWHGTSADLDATSAAYARGAALFWSRLDWAYGRSPGAIVAATWAMSPTMTALGADHFQNEPDKFDVLRMSFKNALSTGSSIDDLLLDTAVARAFSGSADDGFHLPETAVLGDAARVPLDWDLPWPAAPRRLLGRSPVYPTGASYVAIGRAGARPDARLRIEIEWEEHALFRWVAVKLDARGRELGRVVVPTPGRATQVQMSLVDLTNADRILLVGVNVGDPAYRFDPDDEVWEPHGYLLTIAAE